MQKNLLRILLFSYSFVKMINIDYVSLNDIDIETFFHSHYNNVILSGFQQADKCDRAFVFQFCMHPLLESRYGNRTFFQTRGLLISRILISIFQVFILRLVVIFQMFELFFLHFNLEFFE